MPLRQILRVTNFAWIAPALLVVALVYAGLNAAAESDPYVPALTAAGQVAAYVVAPVCAALAAWEASRLRRAGWWGLPHARSSFTIAVSSLGPVVLLGWAAVAIAIVSEFARVQIVALPELGIVALGLAVVLTQAAFGFMLGLRLPTVVAAPVALIVGYNWLVMPRAFDPLWVRHLNGMFIGCCMLSARMAPEAVTAALLVCGGFLATAILLSRSSVGATWTVLSIVPTLIGLAWGVSLVRHLGPDPVVARDGAELVCAGSRPEVCVWPEHRSRLRELEKTATTAVERWRAVGVPVPASFSEARAGTLPPKTAPFGISLETTNSQLLQSLVYGMVPAYPACIETEPYPAYPARAYVEAWYAVTAGAQTNELQSAYGGEPEPGQPPILQLVERVRSLPAARQRAWLERNQAALRSCGTEPQIIPRP